VTSQALSSKSDMKIVSLSLDNGPGGIAVSIVTYAEACKLAGIEHSLIIANGSPAIDKITQNQDGAVFAIPKLRLRAHLSTGFLGAPGLARILDEADVILLHNARLIRLMGRHKKKSVIVNHTGKLRFLDEAADIIFISQSAKNRYLDQNPSANPSANPSPQAGTATLPIIPHAFSHIGEPSPPRQTSKPIKFIAAGRMVAKKGFADLLEAAIELGPRADEFSLHIYGDGPEYKALSDRLQMSGATHIHLPGWTDQLADKLAASDVFCLPSLVEAFGLVLGEAMLHGLPSIAAKTDGSLQIFGEAAPEKNGALLYTAGDRATLKRHMESFLDRPQTATELGVLARMTVEENFSVDRLADNFRKLVARFK
jgi:glycosyltransferase involved in cell wall biosynthesis